MDDRYIRWRDVQRSSADAKRLASNNSKYICGTLDRRNHQNDRTINKTYRLIRSLTINRNTKEVVSSRWRSLFLFIIIPLMISATTKRFVSVIFWTTCQQQYNSVLKNWQQRYINNVWHKFGISYYVLRKKQDAIKCKTTTKNILK